MIKTVLDTNILISGLIVKGNSPPKIIDYLRLNKFLLITSEYLLWEFQQTVRYPKIRQKYKLAGKEIKEYFQAIKNRSKKIQIQAIPKIISEDFSDNLVLATAIEGKADFIVSGDKHLLNLNSYKKIKIIKAGKFVNTLKDFL